VAALVLHVLPLISLPLLLHYCSYS